MDTENVHDSLPATSSFSNAPFDILEEIFMACPTPLNELDGSLKPKTYFECFTESLPAWALSGVCQHWRESALSMPALWSTALIDRSAIRSGRRREDFLVFLSLLLERSKNVPLTIHLDCDGDNEDVLNILSPHISRARVLYIRFHENPELGLRNLLSGSRFPFLYSLSASIYPGGQFSPISPAFAHAPFLERLCIETYSARAQWIDSIGMPWSQICYFKSGGLFTEITSFYKNLLRMPNLIHLDLDNIRFSSDHFPSEPLPYTRLEYLTCIRLSHTASCEAWDHLNNLELPALTEMDLRGVPLSAVKSLLERSKCASQLNALTLWGTDSGEIGRETIKEILFMTPNLVSLNLQTLSGSLHKGEDFIQLFTPNPDAERDGLPSGVLLPKLTTLQIEPGKSGWFRINDFIDGLVSREVLPTVKRVTLPGGWGTTVYEISGVQEVKETYYPEQ
ncbi:hypothetical protein QCA50_013699 [Cerrena zonata]|uniref:F-box domain-containing protein n=1 Tax=Cerrena zonata TaxID=2478898 RepID=A0AAW0FUP3_9APHY